MIESETRLYDLEVGVSFANFSRGILSVIFNKLSVDFPFYLKQIFVFIIKMDTFIRFVIPIVLISSGEGFRGKSVCYGPSYLSCTSPQLACADGYVLSVATGVYGRKPASKNCPNGGDICTADTSCCKFEHYSEKIASIQSEIMLSVQQNCTFQQSCSVSIPYVSSPEYHFTYFSYDCIEAASVLSLMCEDSVTTQTYSYMYYSGINRKDNLAVNCSCELTTTGDVTLYTRYIHLNPQSCPSFETTLATLNLSSCTTNSSFEQKFDFIAHLPTPVKITVKNLMAHEDDIFWVRFNSKVDAQPITVSCTGCGVNVVGSCGRTIHVHETCYGAESCSDHHLSCKNGNFIVLTSAVYYGYRNYETPICQKATCNTDTSCCVYNYQDALINFQTEESSALYKSCLYQQSCITSPQYKTPDNATYAYYRYECVPESSSINMMTSSILTGFSEVFLNYKGSNRTNGTVIDCSCDVTSISPTLTLAVYYMKMHPDSCCQLNISTSDVILPEGCSEQGLNHFYSVGLVVNSPVKFKLNHMLARKDDSLLFRVSSGKGVTVNCGGCIEQTENIEISSVCDYSIPDVLKSQAEEEEDGDNNIIEIGAGVGGGLALLAVLAFVIWKCKKSKKNMVNSN